MNKNLFCFRSEQTDWTGLLQDALTGALIGLARASESSADLLTPETDALIQRSLSAYSPRHSRETPRPAGHSQRP